MFLNAYSTYPLSGYNTKDTIQKIKEDLVRHDPNIARIANSVYVILPTCKNIPSFSHPLEVDGVMVFDIRSYAAPTQDVPYFKVRNPELFYFNSVRSELELTLETEPYRIRSLNSVVINTWIRMLCDNTSRRCGLVPADLVNLNIAAAIYYFCLFEDDKAERWDELDWARTVNKISIATRINPDQITAAWDGRIVHGIQGFIDMAKEIVDKTNLEILNVALLYQLVGSFKMGLNMRETMCVALEHIPTWIALVATGIQYRNNDQMANVLKMTGRGDAGDRLVNGIRAIKEDM